MSVATRPVFRIKRHFAAPAERVFDAWLDPQTASRWLFTDAKGKITRCEIDARVGGRFLIVDTRAVGDVDHVGEYLEIDRPRRLVFTFAVPRYSPEETRVTLDIVPSGTGCELTLTHENVLPEWAERTQQGWSMILDGLYESLRAYAELVNPDTLRFERLLPGPIDRVWAYLTESDKRAQWLAAGEMEPHQGGSVILRFDHATLSKEMVPAPEKFKDGGCGQTPHRVTVWDPPRTLGLTWGTPDEPSEVTFELTPQEDKVRLVLTHRRLVNRATRLGVASGWHTHLSVFEDRLNGREARAFWTTFSELEAEYEKRLG